MRLAIVAPSAYVFGGVQTWLDYLVPGLEARGWNVTVLLVHGSTSDANKYIQKHPFKQVQFVINATGSREGRVRSLESQIEKSGAAVVLNVNIADTYDAVARLRKTKNGKLKVVMALHGLNAAFYEDILKYSSLLDGVIATNRLSVSAASELCGMPAERAYYAPCGVSVPDTHNAEIKTGTLTLLYSGRIDKNEKNVLDLAPILSGLEREGVSYRLRIAGSGADEVELQKALEPFGDKVEFLGLLDMSVAATTFYEYGAICIILSPRETGPIVAWEAMAHGVAVASSDFIGSGLESGLINDQNCLKFSVGNVDAAVKAIVRLAQPEFRRSIIEAAHKTASTKYSLAASVHSWNGALKIIEDMPILRSYENCSPPVSGRLDAFFGVAIAETIRRIFGVKYRHNAPGNEWPHSYGSDSNLELQCRIDMLDKDNGREVSSG